MALGKIGVAALCPKTIRVVFRTQTCEGTQDVPAEYAVDVQFPETFDKSGNGHDAVLTVHDAAHAKYPPSAGTPSNADALKTLATAIATEVWTWRKDRRDRSYAGIVAPDVSGLFDQIEWQMDDDGCRTRFASEPMNVDPEEYMHADLVECAWDGAGFRAFVPNATLASGNLTLPIARLYVDNGKLAMKSNGTQVIKICP